MSHAPFLSKTMSFYQPTADQPVHDPTSSTPRTARFNRLSYSTNTIGNHLSLPDKLELLNSVRSRSRSSLESLTSQTTPLGGSPPVSPRIDRNSFPLLAKILTEQESLSSLVSIDEEKLGQSKDGIATEVIDGVHSVKRRTVKPTSTPIAVTSTEREESSVMVTKANHASLMESVIRTNTTANPFNDSLTRKLRANENISQDSLTQFLEEKASLNIKDKPRRARLSLDSSPLFGARRTVTPQVVTDLSSSMPVSDRLSHTTSSPLEEQSSLMIKEKPRRVRLSLDSSPLFGRTAPPLVVPDHSSSSPAPDRSSFTTLSPATVKLPELDTEVNVRS